MNCYYIPEVSRELSLHPVHLTHDQNGNLPPSALVPFCSYKGDAGPLGREISILHNETVCERFEQIVIEGQLCYFLDVAKYTKKPAMLGKRKGLFLLLDPNPYQIVKNGLGVEIEENDKQSFKVFIHTLAQHTAYGPGAYGMHALKKMISTDNFLQLPDGEKKCRVHNQEECRAEKFLDQVISNCSCVPWPLASGTTDKKVSLFSQDLI